MQDHAKPQAAQTLTALKILLDRAGLAPRKRHGQHFLIDGNLMQKLVDSAELTEKDCVLEVGVGTGSLTSLLSARSGSVLGIEIDRDIIRVAEETLAGCANVVLLRADALKSKSVLNPDLLAGLHRAMSEGCESIKLVANLPYDIATSLVINLLLAEIPISRLCFTVQKEVGDRFMSAPDTSDYGAVGIVAQSLAKTSRIARVPAEAFWPRPKVESVMIRLDPFSPFDCPISDPNGFASFVRGFFLHRRKTMSHLIKSRPDHQKGEEGLQKLAIDSRSRPEQLSVSQWQQLFKSMQ